MAKELTAEMLAEVFAAASDGRNYFDSDGQHINAVIDGIYDLEELAKALNDKIDEARQATKS